MRSASSSARPARWRRRAESELDDFSEGFPHRIDCSSAASTSSPAGAAAARAADHVRPRLRSIEDGPEAGPVPSARVGQHGRVFDVLKFRSMSDDAERRGPWAEKDDASRASARSSQDAHRRVPQLVNVLRGEMSFVGPRPERPSSSSSSSGHPLLSRAPSVKPGITGWAQLCYPYGSPTRRAREAAVRPLLREESQPAVRSGDTRADGRGRPVGEGRALTAGPRAGPPAAALNRATASRLELLAGGSRSSS